MAIDLSSVPLQDHLPAEGGAPRGFPWSLIGGVSSHPHAPAAERGDGMARSMLVLYLLVLLGPLALAAAAFALRDLLARRRPPPSEGNGHAEADGLAHTVEEVRAP